MSNPNRNAIANPSWKWLPSRPTAPQLAAQAAASKAPSRPCLPSVEPLDQRLLLSATNGDIIVEPPDPTGSPAILIGLIKGELELIKGELQALKLAAADPTLAQTPNLIHKLTQSFLKIDDVFYKLGGDIIKFDVFQKLGDIKGESIVEKKALDEINTEFLKITDLLGDPGRQLTGVIETLKHNAISLVGELLKMSPGGELSHKDEQSLLQLASKFESAGDAVLKFQEAALARKAGKHQEQYLEVKFQDLLVSSSKIVQEYKDQVDVEGIITILIGLLKGTKGSTDGVSIVTTDDVITG